MSMTGTMDRHIMIAINESNVSDRALMYVAGMLGGLPGFRLTVLSLIPLPPDGHFESEEERLKWLEGERDRAARLLGRARELCLQAGFPEGSVETRAVERRCASVSDCILKEVREAGACTLVVGRRGVSEKEEFLFGSTSSQVLHDARGCAVWVVE
jgi:nucleotide-binding universal stress UspA family protein